MRPVLLTLALWGLVLMIVLLAPEPVPPPVACDPTFAIVCPEGTEVVLDGPRPAGD